MVDLFNCCATYLIHCYQYYYAIEILNWVHTVQDEIEKAHRMFCKYMLCVSPSAAVLDECGKLLLLIHYIFRFQKYWTSLATGYNVYIHSCYNLFKSFSDAGRVTWVSNVKDILFRYGFDHVWINQTVGDTNLFLEFLKVRLRDYATQNWFPNSNFRWNQSYNTVNLQKKYIIGLPKFR